MSSRSLLDRYKVHMEASRTYIKSLNSWLQTHPGMVSSLLASLFLAYAAFRLFGPLPADTWPELSDSVIFEYAGWYLSQGNRLYLDIWEIKPPLAFEVTAILAFIAGPDVTLYHILNLLANSIAIAISAAAAAGILYELTDDALGSVVAGLTPFGIPFYYYRALIGFKPKYFVIAAGLSSLYLTYKRRHVAAGFASVSALGFWQLAVIFPISAIAMGWQTDGRSGLKHHIIGAAAAAVVILLPVIVWDAVTAMIAEVLLTPLLLDQSHTTFGRIQLLTRVLRRGLPIALIGLVGIVGGLVPGRIRFEWPLVLITGWFTIQLLTLDFDTRPDIFPWIAMVSIGVGLLVSGSRQRFASQQGLGDRFDDSSSGSEALALAVLAFVCISVATMGGFGTGNTGLTKPNTYDTGLQLEPSFNGATTYDTVERQYVFWNRVPIQSCRAFGASNQFELINKLDLANDRPWYDVACGQVGPIWRGVRAKYGI